MRLRRTDSETALVDAGLPERQEDSIGESLSEERADRGGARLLFFPGSSSGDLFEKCRRFHEEVKELKRRQLYQVQYRVTLEGPLDHWVASRLVPRVRCPVIPYRLLARMRHGEAPVIRRLYVDVRDL